MTIKIPIKKKDKLLSTAVKIAEKIETFNGTKILMYSLLAEIGVVFLSSDIARGSAIRFVNSAYNKLRTKYGISDEAFIHVHRDCIEILDV